MSSLFAFAPLVVADVANAQSIAGIRSHVSVSEWAKAPTQAAAPTSTAASVARSEAKLAEATRADEEKRLAEIKSPEGQARLAAEARRNMDERVVRQMQFDHPVDRLREAQTRETNRLSDEAREAEARRQQAVRAEAEAKRRADADRAAAERRHREELERAAAAARTAAEQDAAEARRLEVERQAEERRQATVRLEAAEAARRVEAERAAAAEARAREAEAQSREAAARASAAERDAQARAEVERQRTEAARVAEAERARAEAQRRERQQADDARRQADAARAAEAAQRSEAARMAAARENRRQDTPSSGPDYAPPLASNQGRKATSTKDEALPEFKPVASPEVTVARVETDANPSTHAQSAQSVSQAQTAPPIKSASEARTWEAATVDAARAADRSALGQLTLGKTGAAAGAQQLAVSEAAMALQAAAPRKSYDSSRETDTGRTAAAAEPKVRGGKASAAPTSGAPGQFARWLETQPDDYGTGSTPSGDKLREIFWNAVQVAAERSPEVRQAYANYQASNADVAEAKGQRWPQIDIGSQSPTANFGPGGGNGGGNSGNPLSINVTTNVFDWGRTKHTIGSRQFLSDAANRAYDAALGSSAFEVSTTLVELGKQRNIVDLSQQYVDRMATLVRMLSEIVEVDRGRGSELTQAKTKLLQAEASRDTAKAKVRDAELTLKKLVGDEAVLIPRTREWSIEPGNLPKLLSQVGVHPSLQQAKSEADAADLNAKAVKASGLPQVNWVVSAGVGKDGLGRQQPWQTMLTLNWGAFRGGSASAATDAASARATASWQRMEQQSRDLEYAVRTADQDAHTMLQRADLYRGLSSETDRVRKAFFEQWYHLGKRTLLDVLTAESEHYGNRVAEVTNRFDGYQAVFREHHAAGGLAEWLRNEPGS
ncbi:TolC family protein [Burkholderia lata]|uniref:TolC family protein n=1 Tax=Burkholderia lata (strain ATCC 17760 / DSM 23089 / LMG 22485 / NCIMB 9086 / R18194 / 383) TaxID=482957 RepID=UPI0020C5BDB7|nr:TolC family protein [Burkholderia lata]